MFGIEFLPTNGADVLEIAWAVQASLTILACVGMVGRLLRRQRHLNA